jgi:hypothetical protein
MDFSTLITAADPTLDPLPPDPVSLVLYVALAFVALCGIVFTAWQEEAS